MKSLHLGMLVFALGYTAAISGQPEGVTRPFNGRNLEGWKTRPEGNQRSYWTVGQAKLDPADPRRLVVEPGGNELINAVSGHGEGLDLYSEALHGDAIIRLEVMVPRESNSGIYVMGEYEIQVLDSFGREQRPGPGDMGAIYGAQPPRRPKYKAPGEWNTYEIHWRAPRFDASGKKVTNARFEKVILNGVVIHENVEMPGPTPGGLDGREKPQGPLMFQGNHGPVAYRNLEILPLR
ncbi:MAG: DUF1080 domain-containing protein [Verrucomicrobiota bacterium]|nr:DUF1080 domain-containing protein [Limisphaera sp.]MDW8382043.1 DUF1080 domain-containing protein [Verrucomicrobiota bacterium]